MFWGRRNLGMCFCTNGAQNKGMSLGSREAVAQLESLKLVFEAREYIGFFFSFRSINNSWQAETTLIARDEVEQPAGSTAE